MMDFKCYDKSHRSDIHVRIKTDTSASLNDLPGQERDTGIGEEYNLTLKRIVADALQYMDKAKDKFEITITKINPEDGHLLYRIEGESGLTVRNLSLSILDLKATVEKIAEHKIIAIGEVQEEVGAKSLLVRFSEHEPMPKGFFARVKWIVSRIFHKLRDTFTFIDRIYEGVTHASAKKLKWDVNVLAEVCGNPPTENISIHDSLKYLHKVMKREKGVAKDPELAERLHGAVKASTHQIALRKKFSVRGFDKNSKLLLAQVDRLKEGKKMLLPVGFYEGDELKEMLLEIGKEVGGKFTVSLISASPEMREYFDRENSVHGGTQSIRREILNVDRNDLHARLPLFLELATSPACRVSNASNIPNSWRLVFFDALKFPDSVVAASPPTERFTLRASAGHVREAIAYLDEAQGDPEEARRFDLALRLRLFLDVCKSNKKSWSDPRFWSLVKTTAHELAWEIEENKEILGGKKAQATELSKIYHELREILGTLEASPPKTVDPSTQSLDRISGGVQVKSEPEVPMVTLVKIDTTEMVDVKPPFTLLDKDRALDSFMTWNERLKQLSTLGHIEMAANEGKLIVRMLPAVDDPFWKKLTKDEVTRLVKALNTAAEALVRNIRAKNDATLEEMIAISLLNYYGCLVGSKEEAASTKRAIKDFVEELLNCRISPLDRENLIHMKEAPHEPTAATSQLSLQTLRSALSQVRTINLNAHDQTPLHLQHPEYAKITADEITNRYISQQCPLGCTGDNCPNYAMTDKKLHRFHPLYMVHNFANIFGEKAIDRGLARDEYVDLLYTQTTLQNAHNLFESLHKAEHGTKFAHGFNAEDRQIQVLMTWMAFMQHTDFFKSPELRWHFETKLFTEEAFSSLLAKPAPAPAPGIAQRLASLFTGGNAALKENEHLPFVRNMLKQLTKEIRVAYAAGEIEKCAYLAHVQNRIAAIIEKHKDLSDQEKVDLKKLLLKDIDKLLPKLLRDFLYQNADHSVERQRMVYTLCINMYYEKFCINPHDPAFDDHNDLVNILVMSQRLDLMKETLDKVDPEFVDRYRTLLALVHPCIKKQCDIETPKGKFANNLLMVINPNIAARNLPWEMTTYPMFMAKNADGAKFFLNLATGEVSIGARKADPLPTSISGNPTIKRLFGASLKEIWSKLGVPEGLAAEKTVAYVHPSFPQFRILLKETTTQGSEVVVERTVTSPEGKLVWVSYVRFRDQDRVLKGENIPVPDDLPIQVAAAVGDRDCWVDREKKYIYVMEGKKEQPYAIISLENEMIADAVITRVVDMAFMEENTHLLHPDPRALERFTTIESPQFLQVKGKGQHFTSQEKKKAASPTQNTPSQIEYLRYTIAGTGARLIYTLGKEGATSLTFPGYRLADYGSRPGSKDPAFGAKPLPDTFDGYQLLRKGGREKVLIPMRPFEQQFSVKGSPLPYSKTQFPDNFTTCPLFEYRVDVDSNRLIADSPDAYAYLAYVCWTHGDYGSSRFYLDKARTSTGYSEGHDQIMKWLDDWKDDSPNGAALRLHFGLFQEKIIEDRRNVNIVQGKLKSVAELDFNRSARSVAIAKQYEVYMKAAAAGEVEPALELSPGEHIQTQQIVRELLQGHGAEAVDRGEATPVRAVDVPLQQYLEEDTKDPLIYQKGALLMWSQRIGEKGVSSVTVRDPLWIVQNFRDIFNRILKDDPNSPAVKRLVLQVELVSRLPNESLNPVEMESLTLAQSYLLKLISARREYPTIFGQFPPNLPAEGLPNLHGPKSVESRNNAILLAAEAAKCGLYTKEGIKNKDTALSEMDENTLKVFPELKKCLGGTRSFIQNYTGNNFYRDYRYHLLECFYGRSAARSIDLLDQVLKVLEPIPITIPQQTFAKPSHPLESPMETNQQRYASLLTAHVPATSTAEIDALRKSIFTGNEPAPPQHVVTVPQKHTFVLGSLAKECTSPGILRVDSVPLPPIDRTIFSTLKNSDEPAVVRNATEHERDMDAALVDKKSVTVFREGANRIISALSEAATKSEMKQETLRKDLMQLLEHFDTDAGILAMRRLTGRAVKPNLDTIIALWRRGEITRAWDDNILKQLGLKKMTPEVLKDLDARIQDLMVAVTNGRHIKRTLELATEYQKSCGPEKNDVGDKPLALELYDTITTKRFYALDDSDVRDLLFMEYSQGIILREGQVTTFRDMISEPNAVRQLSMGGGKSQVILPLLAKRKANGQNLVMLVLPEDLYNINCGNLDITNRMLFGQKMHRFDFCRETETNLEALQVKHLRLLETIQEQGFIMTTKKNVLSFRNAFAEKLCKLRDLGPAATTKRAELLAEIREMNSILFLFKNHTDAIADEVDACLDIRKEVNFSLGENSPIDQIKRDVGVRMMDILLEATDGSLLGALKTNIINNTQASMSQVHIDACMEEIAKIYRGKFNLAFNEKGFLDYMMDKPSGKGVEAEVNALKQTDNDLYRQITALKGFIHKGFGNTLKNVGRVKYGRDPVSGIWTIPYKASNTPSIGSEFDDDIERISFTIQDYLQFGVSYKPVFQAIATLHARAVQELRAAEEDPDNNMIGINDTAAAKDFEELLKKMDPEGRAGRNLTLAAIANPSRIEALVAAINGTPEGRLAFVGGIVFDQMMQTNTQINAVSSDLPEMVRNFSGFTGTPWNLLTYHDKIQAQKNLGVDGLTWALMLSRDIPIKTFNFDAMNPTESLLSELDIVGKKQALIDAGAYLRGVSNEAFVDQVMKRAKERGVPLEGVIYADEAAEIVKKTSLDVEALKIETAPETDLMKTFTLYDNARCVGADVKQGKKAVAAVTIGENTFIRDLFQAVWRLRQLGREQRFELAVSEKIKEKILGGEQRDLTIVDILKFCLSNEAKREAEDNFRAERGKIANTPKRVTLNTTIDLIQIGIDDESIVNLANILVAKEGGLLLKNRPGEEAFDEYGAIKSQEAPHEQLARLKETAGKLCANVANRLEDIDQRAATTLRMAETTVKARPDRPVNWMPKLVDAAEDVGGKEVEIEAQAIVELELEMLTQNLTEEETTKEKEVVIPMVVTGAAGSGNVDSIQPDKLHALAAHNGSTNELRQVSNVCDFFDQEIYSTEVFERNLPTTSHVTSSPQSLFYTTRKTPNTALIFKDNTGRMKMVIPTVHEAHDACRKFVNESQYPAAVVAITPAEPLMFYKSGKDRTEALPFIEDQDRSAFYRLYVQLKLFNGEIEFGTQAEKEALTLWLQEKGVERFREYYEKNILAAKPRRFANAYPQSSLCKLFDELLALK